MNKETEFNEQNFRAAFPDIPLSKDEKKIRELNNIVADSRRELNKMRREMFTRELLCLAFGAVAAVIACYYLIPGAC